MIGFFKTLFQPGIDIFCARQLISWCGRLAEACSLLKMQGLLWRSRIYAQDGLDHKSPDHIDLK
jgi:hypothetical protein